MAQTLQDAKDAITAMAASNEALRVAVEADVAQSAKTVEAIDALVEAIQNSGNTDFTELVEALVSEKTKMEASTEKLASDNAAVQAAIDKAVPPAA